MKRTQEAELLETQQFPPHVIERTYRDIATIHNLLGDTREVCRKLREGGRPPRRVLDVGCGRGDVLEQVRRALGIEGLGVDLEAHRNGHSPVPILRADALHDDLPAADAAYCMYLAHHLTEEQLIALIRNVGRSCRRFLILDLVRHPVPLLLFNAFVALWVSPVVKADGRTSIRRAYTPAEMRIVVGKALAGSGAKFEHSVTPLRSRQLVDIHYD